MTERETKELLELIEKIQFGEILIKVENSNIVLVELKKKIKLTK
jgi:hypothetical protein